MPGRASVAGDVPGVVFVQAYGCRRMVPGRPIDLLVLHCMQSPDKPAQALGVGRWFALAPPKGPGTSAHYGFDGSMGAEPGEVQYVREHDIAWAAPGANHNGIHFELAGMAEQTAVQWGDRYSLLAISRSARRGADVSLRHSIPLDFVDAGQLASGWRHGRPARGVTTHWEVTRAGLLEPTSPFAKNAGHHDPGPDFPMDDWLAIARQEANALAGA